MNALQSQWQRLLPHPLARRLALVILLKLLVLTALIRIAAAWLPVPRPDSAQMQQRLFGTPAAAPADPTEAPLGVDP